MAYPGRRYNGHVVAKLPFEPPGFIQYLSHSGLEGENATDCAFMFIYILSMTALRPVGAGAPQ